MKNDGFQRINAPAHHELNRCYTHEINELNGVHTISSQMIIQHCKYVDDMILNEIRKVMIEENIPEMYIFNDSWIIEAFREKMEREREV